MPAFDYDQAVSPLIGTILMVAIVILLAALLLLMIQLPSFNLDEITKTPSFIEIRRFYHVDENGYLNYDSRLILYHNGTEDLRNSDLWAEFYRNGTRLPAVIETMNGYAFINTHHYGVQTMGGLGCSGPAWSPGEKISLDFTDGTFHPGDEIRVDIFSRPSGTLISRSFSTA